MSAPAVGAVAQLTSLDFIVQVLVIGALLYIIMHLARSIWRTSRQPTVVPARPMSAQPKQPITRRAYTLAELRAYNGSDPSKPLLVGVKGTVFDVSRGRNFYGPGGPYAVFSGRDASRALAKNSTETADVEDCSYEGLPAFELQSLDSWYEMFKSKYQDVGWLERDLKQKL